MTPTYTINAAGRIALAAHLASVLRDPSTLTDRALDAWIADAEQSAYGQCGTASIEVPARLHRLGRAEEWTLPAEGVDATMVEA